MKEALHPERFETVILTETNLNETEMCKAHKDLKFFLYTIYLPKKAEG
jgi:hypothetical protein